MRIWRSLEEVPADLGHTVVTIGNFDGVHLGHVGVLQRARQVADRLDLGHVVAVTFDPHPIAVLRPVSAPAMLSSIERRAELLEAAGADDLLVVPFTDEVSDWPPERFVEEILVDTLHASAVVVGANFRFGHRAAGDVALLHRLGVDNEFIVEGIELSAGPQVWSSTYVRTCLATGDVAGAAEALGRPYSVRGVVGRGDGRGRGMGWPTANLAAADVGAVPTDGVYAGWLRVLPTGERHPVAISVGKNPTFPGQRERRVESYVIDGPDDLDLYDLEVEVEFVAHLREQRRFDDAEQLGEAIEQDVREARAALGIA
ncbi:bifunctional riboflavin kinase/FAD synthetase [Nocardioides marmoribigeumensis]|uniref:Riboflavin biosynthesis protein n=1 Tax=Nocardioides marmoribigeumensis TaxID=433649 RepID=A0ABU2BRX2_9ACTN|nr:bifunctional riboflavin kinase/FAD synthetase [Nocardioides marmoribigeumensis]MDR7361397.1 riboflavin kinase/FMN adenylyltransferase [Nocardioides marmoribigeumensis]